MRFKFIICYVYMFICYIYCFMPLGWLFCIPWFWRVHGLFWFICCFQHPTQPSTIVLQQTFHPPPNQVSFTRNFFITFIFKTLKVPDNRVLLLGEKIMFFFQNYPQQQQPFIPTYQQQPPPYNTNYWSKIVFVDLLWSPRIDSQAGVPVQQPYLSYRPDKLHRLAKSIPRNRFLGSINVYKYGLSCSYLPTSSSHRPTTPTTEQLFIPTCQQQPPPYNTTYWIALHCTNSNRLHTTATTELL